MAASLASCTHGAHRVAWVCGLRPARHPRTFADMSADSRAVANVARIIVAARRHGRQAVDLGELEVALADVDVEALAWGSCRGAMFNSRGEQDNPHAARRERLLT